MSKIAPVVSLILLLSLRPSSQTAEPTVRIGLEQNAAQVTVRSAVPFEIDGRRTRTVTFSNALVLPADMRTTAVPRQALAYRLLAQLDNETAVVLAQSRVRIALADTEPAARLQIGDRTYRGVIEVFGSTRNTLTVVNELPLEDYLLGVVPNELSPTTFGELEALKAQAVAARTYIMANLGQFRAEGYDICNTDACQVYFGAGTEDPLATRAVAETRGLVATFDGRPIKALYSSTCGGRTESSENIFDERLPYLRSVACEYEHAERKHFETTGEIASYRDAVLAVAGVATFSDLQRFLSISPRPEPRASDLPGLAAYIRETFYPDVRVGSDLDFLAEQNILSPIGMPDTRDVLFRLIDRKSAFEWQQGILLSWRDGVMTLAVAGKPVSFRLAADAPVFFRRGDDRTAVASGDWIGGELIEFRAVGDQIQMLTYRRNYATPSADRYSRLAIWQLHKTKQEIDTAFQSLNIGEVRRMRLVERGESGRPVVTDVTGTRGTATIRALRLRNLLALRDSLFSFDEERNAEGTLLGMTFYGQGWGHGVGMCQVGAYGMAMDGASYEQILTKYYTGIAVSKMYP